MPGCGECRPSALLPSAIPSIQHSQHCPCKAHPWANAGMSGMPRCRNAGNAGNAAMPECRNAVLQPLLPSVIPAFGIAAFSPCTGVLDRDCRNAVMPGMPRRRASHVCRARRLPGGNAGNAGNAAMPECRMPSFSPFCLPSFPAFSIRSIVPARLTPGRTPGMRGMPGMPRRRASRVCRAVRGDCRGGNAGNAAMPECRNAGMPSFSPFCLPSFQHSAFAAFS